MIKTFSKYVTVALMIVSAAFFLTFCEPTPSGSGSGGSGGGAYQDQPVRNPYENDHDYRLRQQGSASPCSHLWQAYEQAYFNWQNKQITYQNYKYAEGQYDDCCLRHGYSK